MKSFGKPSLYTPQPNPTATPIGEPCGRCEEPIVEGDAGVILPHLDGTGVVSEVPFHRACFLRGVLGSVGHQQRRCSCFGGTEEDPPEMSKREAAKAAVRNWMNREEA